MKTKQTLVQICLLGVLLLSLPAAAQAQFDYSINNGTITVTGYTGSGGAVTIPSTINGYLVTSIGEDAFFDTSLTSVIIPNSVTSIGDDAFDDCRSLASVTIPNSVISIGDYAFDYCSSLTNIIIPDSVTSIGDYAFASCSSLPAITVTPGNSFYSSLNGVLFNVNQTTLLEFPGGFGGSYTIPDGVTSIADYAFAYCSYLTSVAISDSVTSIGDYAFDDCDLTSVTIPNSVTNIGDYAFGYCSSLTSITIPDSVTSVGEGMFEYCFDLTSVTIGNNVTNIGEGAFVDCYDLTSVAIPNSVTSIGESAFYGCGLTSVTIPNSITSIGYGVFEECGSLGSVTMSTNLTSIGTYAFSGYPSGDPLTSVVIPTGVTNIGEGAFQYCFSLTNATIGDSVTTIGDLAFEFSGLSSVTIPDSVTNIGNVAFADCLHLTAITVNAQNAYYSSVDGVLMDKNQTTLLQFPSGLGGTYDIPNGLTTIGSYSFYGSALSSLTIPNSVTTIEGVAFYICGNLSSITIGSGVTNLGGSAFYYCTSIPLNLYFQGNAPGGDYDPFYGENFASMTVYYLSGASDWQFTFWGVPTVMLNAPTNGSLQVTISPAGAVAAGAEWQVDGGEFQTNEAIVTNLSVGSHTVSFSTISGWTTPANETVSIVSNSTTTATGTYVAIPQTGSLQVTITPTAAITAGAQWQVDGGTLQNSGATVANLSVGDHTVSFTTISGWTTPSTQIVSVSANSTATATGAYVSQAPPPFTWTTNNGAITITGYTGSGGTVTIPSTINGLPVTSIAYEAFFDKASLTGVTIPNSVTGIGSFAFFACSGLTSVAIPASVISIGEPPFQGCTALTAITVDAENPFYSSINGVLFSKGQTTLIEYPGGLTGSYTIPETVTNIEAGAFYICPDLTGITIPLSVANIGEEAFSDSSSLTTIIVDAQNPTYSSINGVLFNKSQTSLVQYPGGLHGSYTIPRSVTSIGQWAFAICTTLTSVVIPNSVTNIGDYAFYSCDDLTAVYFPGNAPSVDSTVFYDDPSATIYYLPGTIGWSQFLSDVDIPGTLWTLPYPLILDSANGNTNLGVQNNQFGFTISWATNLSVVVQASTNLVNPVWTPVMTNTLTNGSIYFSDPQWTNYPGRFYRISAP